MGFTKQIFGARGQPGRPSKRLGKSRKKQVSDKRRQKNPENTSATQTIPELLRLSHSTL